MKLFFVALSALITFKSAFALELDAQSYYIYHPETDTVVMEKNPDMQIAPASLTKMMTVYLVFDALRKGDVTPDTEIPVSEKAWRKGGSKMFIEVGKHVRVEDLIKGILVSSGNDACIAVAEYFGGTEEGFAEMMNLVASDLGMENTTFANASGWPDIKQLTTAKDMAILASAIIDEFPEYYGFFGLERFTYNGISQPNRNGLIARNIGVDGMKTGHIEEAGYHLTASAERDDVRLVSVVMGADSKRAREEQTLTGLSYVFRTHQLEPVVTKGEVVVQTLPVEMSEHTSVDLVANDTLKAYFNKRVKQPFTTEIEHPDVLEAPLKAGQEVGVLRVTFTQDDRMFEIPLRVANDRPRLSGMDALIRQVQMFFGG